MSDDLVQIIAFGVLGAISMTATDRTWPFLRRLAISIIVVIIIAQLTVISDKL